MTAELRVGLGRNVDRKRVERLMRERGLPVSPADAARQPVRPVGTELAVHGIIGAWTAGEGRVYLALVIDVGSRSGDTQPFHQTGVTPSCSPAAAHDGLERDSKKQQTGASDLRVG